MYVCEKQISFTILSSTIYTKKPFFFDAKKNRFSFALRTEKTGAFQPCCMLFDVFADILIRYKILMDIRDYNFVPRITNFLHSL